MRLLLLAILAVPILVVAEPVVVEHRHVIETQVQSLQKRADTCVGALQGNGFTVQTTTCPPGQECCYGSFSSLVACIPSSSLCCDYTLSVSWCPTTARCGNSRFAYCQATDIIPTVDSTTSTPASSSSPSQTPSSSSQSKSLPTSSIIGISVSVACSVLGLLFGVGFKIWKHKRKEKQERG